MSHPFPPLILKKTYRIVKRRVFFFFILNVSSITDKLIKNKALDL